MAALAVAAALIVSLMLGWVSISMGPGLGFVDLPDENLKPHRGQPTLLGGLGLFVGLHVGLWVSGLFDLALFGSTFVMWSVGLIDDRIGVSPKWRLVAAAFAGALMAVLQDPFAGGLAVIAGMALVIVTVNAINLLDGLDALAGSVGAVSALSLAVLAGLRGFDKTLAALVLVSALIGFLVWNRPPARVFLGDNGAYVLGVALAWIAFTASRGWTSGLVAVAVIGVPILDLGATIVRRAVSQKPLFSGDREHSYDRLHASGMGVVSVVAVFAVAQVAWAGSVIAASQLYGEAVAAIYAVTAGSVLIAWLVLRSTRHEDATRPPRQ